MFCQAAYISIHRRSTRIERSIDRSSPARRPPEYPCRSVDPRDLSIFGPWFLDRSTHPTTKARRSDDDDGDADCSRLLAVATAHRRIHLPFPRPSFAVFILRPSQVPHLIHTTYTHKTSHRHSRRRLLLLCVGYQRLCEARRTSHSSPLFNRERMLPLRRRARACIASVVGSTSAATEAAPTRRGLVAAAAAAAADNPAGSPSATARAPIGSNGGGRGSTNDRGRGSGCGGGKGGGTPNVAKKMSVLDLLHK